MIFLLDTNIVIPAEPTSPQDVEVGTAVIAELLASLSRGRHEWLIHPGTYVDVSRDTDNERRTLRTQLLGKYHSLPEPPPLSQLIIDELGLPEPRSNDDIDFHLLAALEADCADYLVTEDRKLRKRATRIGLGARVVSASDALATVRALFSTIPAAPPLVRHVRAHNLKGDDPIFDSLREEYDPHFPEWLRKCKLEQRSTWIIEMRNSYAGVCILKDEKDNAYGFEGKVAKICTFKISENHRGFRFGELLLKAVFHYFQVNNYEVAYVETHEHHEELCVLLADFGFVEEARSTKGELVLIKHLRPTPKASELSPLDYHIAFGPKHVRFEGTDGFIVPIQPKFHRLLFPEAEAQMSLVNDVNPFGNSIRKAYLCHSKIKQLSPGAFVLFYRSKDRQGVRVLGVVEQVLISDRVAEIARFVGKLSVYPFHEIQAMSDRPVLAVIFRQAVLLEDYWPLELLKSSGIVNGPPQSFASIPETAQPWLKRQLA